MPLLDDIKRDSGLLRHSCGGCTGILESSNFVICNPLANYKIVQGKLQLITGNTAELNFTHRHAFGTQGPGDTTTLSDLANNTLAKLK